MKKEYYIFSIFFLAAFTASFFSYALPRPAVAGETAAATSDGPSPRFDESDGATVMIIPLDSRPANTIYPSMICEIAGFKPLLPPAELMDNFKKPADAEKMAEWMLSNAGRADAFVISATMLCYGGLVASRTPEKSLYQALKNLKAIERLKLEHPQKPVFVYDIIQRLAVTAASEKELEYYKLVREWAILDEKVETAPAPGEKERRDDLRSRIPQDVFDGYMKARGRNAAVNMKLVQMCRAGHIDYLVIGQDDASKYGIHKREARALRRLVASLGLGGRFSMFPGADEIDAVLIARLASRFYGRKPKYAVVYPNEETVRWIPPYEDIELPENIRRHIEVSGAAVCAPDETPDITLLMNATAETELARAEAMSRTADCAARLVSEGKLAAVADLSFANRSDTAFVELLAAKADIFGLAAYSAWNTAGNKLGFAIGQASARWHSLAEAARETGFRGELAALRRAKAHYELLMLRFLKDYSYKNFVMGSAEKLIGSLGADKFDLKGEKERVQSLVNDELAGYARIWFERFAGRKMVTGAERKGRAAAAPRIRSLENFRAALPWPRIFECEIRFNFALDAAPVK